MLALLSLLGGCTSLLPPQAPEPKLFVLAAGPFARIAPEKQDVVLEVSAPRALPGFDTPRMAYVQKPYELDYFADNRWIDAPGHMLGPLLAQALEQSGAFRAVVQAPTVVPADIRVDTELIRLQQNFTTRPSQLELTLRVQLVAVHARRVLATQSFEEIVAADSENATGGVAAANVALEQILRRIVDFCVAEVGSQTASPNPAK